MPGDTQRFGGHPFRQDALIYKGFLASGPGYPTKHPTSAQNSAPSAGHAVDPNGAGLDFAGKIIAVWFSCGAASAVAAKLTIERFPDADVRIVNNPVAEEDPDNQRFLRDVSAWLGRPIEHVRHRDFPDARCDSVWKRERGMVFPHGAPCTRYLKKFARQDWEKTNRPDWHVLGFTAEERKRHDRFVLTERDNVIPVLIEAGLTKDDCAEIIRGAGLELPAIYRRGYPNANCIGCVKATSPTYWNHVRRHDPAVFAERARQSREYGAKPVKLVKVGGKRIALDDLPPDAKGRPMKSLRNVDCGVFCEERPPATKPRSTPLGKAPPASLAALSQGG